MQYHQTFLLANFQFLAQNSKPGINKIEKGLEVALIDFVCILLLRFDHDLKIFLKKNDLRIMLYQMLMMTKE